MEPSYDVHFRLVSCAMDVGMVEHPGTSDLSRKKEDNLAHQRDTHNTENMRDSTQMCKRRDPGRAEI